MEIINQVESLHRLSIGEQNFSFHIGGQAVPIIFIRNQPKNSYLLVIFHGAIDRKIRKIPAFVPLIPGFSSDVAQLSISDPSMLRSGNFGMSWYAGHDGFRSQEILSSLFAEIALQGKYKKIVFFGTSGGGFAALYYSSLISNSTALVGVPQTNILKYYAEHVKRYREGCWPNLISDNQLTEEINADLCSWYETPRPNTVIYLQSAGDHFHTRTQLAPFLQSISKVENAKLILNSSYWGKLGHSLSVTKEAYMPWLRTCFICPTNEVDDLLETHRALNHTDNQSEDPRIKGNEVSSVVNGQLKMAEILRNYHLGQA
jgi:hypothetical protein